MKNVILLALLILGTTGFSQSREAVDYEKISLDGLTYKSSYNVFSDESRETYLLEDFENLESGFDWGNFISFGEDTFHTYYSAPCGNDCFTSVNGTYKFVGANRIQVYVESINRSGFCQLKGEEPKKIIGIYQITQTKTGLTFTKE